MEADDVGDRQQLVERIATACESRARAESLDEPRGLPADPPRPDDADELPVQALAEHELEGEAPLATVANQPVSLGHAAQQGQHQRDGELRRRTRQHIGRVRDDDSAPAGSVEVDVVDADRVVGDDCELRPGAVEQRAVDRRRQERKDPVRSFRRVGELEVLGERRGDNGRNGPGDVDSRDARFSRFTELPLVRRSRPGRVHPSRVARGRPDRRAAGDRDLQPVVGARALQPAFSGPRRGGETRDRGSRRDPRGVLDDVARREPDEADDDALPQPDGDGGGGVHSRLPDRRGGADRRLRQDRAGRADGRRERGCARDHDHRRPRAAGVLPRQAALLRHRPLAVRARTCAPARCRRPSSRSSRRPRAQGPATATRWAPPRR